MIRLSKVAEIAPDLVAPYKSAGVSLAKRGLEGQRYAVYLVLDRSGSMSGFYRDGSVQALAERVLALAAHLDDDGTVPVVFFDDRARPPAEITIGQHAGWVAAEHARLGHMGTTDYAAAMRTVIDHYQASRADAPALVIFQTDGAPNNRREAEQVLCQASGLPIFWQFVGFGDDRFEFLRKLDDLPVPGRRVVDNAGFFPAGRAPQRVSDADLYDQLTAELPVWRSAATRARVISA